jgi:hypothetical protein
MQLDAGVQRQHPWQARRGHIRGRPPAHRAVERAVHDVAAGGGGHARERRDCCGAKWILCCVWHGCRSTGARNQQRERQQCSQRGRVLGRRHSVELRHQRWQQLLEAPLVEEGAALVHEELIQRQQHLQVSEGAVCIQR